MIEDGLRVYALVVASSLRQGTELDAAGDSVMGDFELSERFGQAVRVALNTA